MQVSVESTSELTRKMTVRVPEQTIQEKMEAKFNSLARKVKLDGFRPGKVPHHVVKKMFGGQVRSEVIGDLIQSSFYDALRNNDLKPAGAPEIESQEAAEGLEYTARFEVYPEIRLAAPETLVIKRPVSEVTDADVNGMVERLRQQRLKWVAIDRAAALGDQVTMTFSGHADGEDITDGKVENYAVILGSKSMIPGFEDALVGSTTGQHLTFDLAFPEDYGNEKLSGKTAHFDVDVVKVEASELPEIDAEFVKGFGIESGDVGEFLADVKASMDRELKQSIQSRLKTNVMNALYDKNPIALPRVLVDQEIDRLIKPYLEAAKKQKRDTSDLHREAFEESARRRVSLGLVLAEIIKANDIKAAPQRVRAAVEELAHHYERPDDVINWYYSNPQRLSDVEQMVLEDQVVEWILDRATVTDEAVPLEVLLNPASTQ